jgi:hypothetical protein
MRRRKTVAIRDELKDRLKGELTSLLEEQGQYFKDDLLPIKEHLSELAAELVVEEMDGQGHEATLRHLEAQILNMQAVHQSKAIKLITSCVRRTLSRVVSTVGDILLKGVIK